MDADKAREAGGGEADDAEDFEVIERIVEGEAFGDHAMNEEAEEGDFVCQPCEVFGFEGIAFRFFEAFGVETRFDSIRVTGRGAAAARWVCRRAHDAYYTEHLFYCQGDQVQW